MLEDACLTATKLSCNPSTAPLPKPIHNPTDSPVPNQPPPSVTQNPGSQPDSNSGFKESEDEDEEEDKDEVSNDPTCKYKVTVTNNENRRVTRSNRDPETPHCSLIANNPDLTRNKEKHQTQ